MKKILAIMLVLLMAVLSLAGCGEEKKNPEKPVSEMSQTGNVTDDNLLERAIENVKNTKSVYVLGKTESSMESMGQKVVVTSEIKSEVDLENGIQYADITMSSNGQQSKVACYVEEVSGGANVYVSANGTWMKQSSIPMDKVSQMGLTDNATALMGDYLNVLKENATVTEKTVSGRKCVVYSGEVSTKNTDITRKSLGSMLSTITQSGISQNRADEIVANAGKFSVQIAIDKETALPVEFVSDLTEVTNAIMKGLVNQIEGAGEITVEKNIATSTYSKYNELAEIKISDEAKNATEMTLF